VLRCSSSCNSPLCRAVAGGCTSKVGPVKAKLLSISHALPDKRQFGTHRPAHDTHQTLIGQLRAATYLAHDTSVISSFTAGTTVNTARSASTIYQRIHQQRTESSSSRVQNCPSARQKLSVSWSQLRRFSSCNDDTGPSSGTTPSAPAGQSESIGGPCLACS